MRGIKKAAYDFFPRIKFLFQSKQTNNPSTHKTNNEQKMKKVCFSPAHFSVTHNSIVIATTFLVSDSI